LRKNIKIDMKEKDSETNQKVDKLVLNIDLLKTEKLYNNLQSEIEQTWNEKNYNAETFNLFLKDKNYISNINC